MLAFQRSLSCPCKWIKFMEEESDPNNRSVWTFSHCSTNQLEGVWKADADSHLGVRNRSGRRHLCSFPVSVQSIQRRSQKREPLDVAATPSSRPDIRQPPIFKCTIPYLFCTPRRTRRRLRIRSGFFFRTQPQYHHTYQQEFLSARAKHLRSLCWPGSVTL